MAGIWGVFGVSKQPHGVGHIPLLSMACGKLLSNNCGVDLPVDVRQMLANDAALEQGSLGVAAGTWVSLRMPRSALHHVATYCLVAGVSQKQDKSAALSQRAALQHSRSSCEVLLDMLWDHLRTMHTVGPHEAVAQRACSYCCFTAQWVAGTR